MTAYKPKPYQTPAHKQLVTTKYVISTITRVKIIVPLLPEGKFHFLLDGHGRMDYVGQILKQLGFDFPQLDGLRVPSDLKAVVPPFSMSVRRRIIDTSLTLSLLRLDTLPRAQHYKQVEELLRPHFSIDWISSV